MYFNKKGQFASYILVVVIIFIFAIVIFFANHLNNQIYTALGDRLNENSSINSTGASDAIGKIQTVDNSVWDLAFMGLLIGIVIQLVILSYSTRISAVFYFLYAIVSMITLILGVIVSNIWQELASNPEFATTITRFPITDAVLGSNFPLIVAAFIMLGIILLFGKRPGGNNLIQ